MERLKLMFEINGKKVGVDQKPYIIAELSANHGGKLDNAKLAIKVAKESGASAVKIQTYTPDTMPINSLNLSTISESLKLIVLIEIIQKLSMNIFINCVVTFYMKLQSRKAPFH